MFLAPPSSPDLIFIFSSVNGSDVYMNSCFYGNGTSFVESLFEDFGEQILRVQTHRYRSLLFCCYYSALAHLLLTFSPSVRL